MYRVLHAAGGCQTPWDHLPVTGARPRAGSSGFNEFRDADNVAGWEMWRPRDNPQLNPQLCRFQSAQHRFTLGTMWVPHLDSISIAEHLTIWDIPMLASACRSALQELCVVWWVSIKEQRATALELRQFADEWDRERRMVARPWRTRSYLWGMRVLDSDTSDTEST